MARIIIAKENGKMIASITTGARDLDRKEQADLLAWELLDCIKKTVAEEKADARDQ